MELGVKIKGMSLEAKVGQMLFLGLPCNSVAANNAVLGELRPGGMILFARDVSTMEQTLVDVNAYRQTAKVCLPMFVGIDQEGGRVSRLPAAWATKFPTAAQVGRNSYCAKQLAKALGDELSALGVNMNFAPVLDVNSNPENPVIGDRSFGTTPVDVWASGQHVIDGLTEAGVIPVIKHFPGHGDTSIDSHKALAIVTANQDMLESRELVPFRNAVRAGAPVVMVGHLLIPALDPEQPAHLSSRIISGLLREQWGFQGVVITDDLEMGAIAQDRIGEVAVQAVLAGADMLMVCHTYSKQVGVYNAILEAVKSGRISLERLDQSVQRIITLKHHYQVNKTPANIDHAREVVGSSKHLHLVESLK